MTIKVGLVSIFVNDPNAAHAFYTEKLGFVTKMHMPEHYLAIVASAADPDGTSVLLEPNGNLGADIFQKAVYDANMPIIVFSTEDIQAEYERLKGQGVTFRQEPTKEDYGTVAVFDDTFGNLIQLMQPPA
jgi:catechol 2,3-dioxygenase-like lactoylglutathione lyase family enzyme